MGMLESLNFDFVVVYFDTMKLIFSAKVSETLMPQGFSRIEKERKLQYLWYHNYRSYMKYVDNNDTVSNGFIWFHLKMKPWHGK